MKIPVYITIVILAAGAGAAWYQHSQIEQVRADQTMLVTKAAERGISLHSKRPTKSARKNHTRIADARKTASDAVDFHAKYASLNFLPGSAEEQSAYKEWKEIVKNFASFDAAQVKAAIGFLMDSPQIAEDRRSGVIYTLIMNLKERDPRAALEMLCATPQVFSDASHRKSTITNTFSILAKKDLNSMIDWLKVIETKLPPDVLDSCKLSAISIAAQDDPRRAFDLIGQLEVKNLDSAISN
ncbi:MAG: hypothetical protein EOP84_35090, partial [Verrucomicrobiaceae bacterium]